MLFLFQITLPCPPNPAKAKKLALLKKQKEDKMKNIKPVFNMEDLNKPKKTPTTTATTSATAKPTLQQQQQMAMDAENQEGEPMARQNKWYMGQYGQSEGSCPC